MGSEPESVQLRAMEASAPVAPDAQPLKDGAGDPDDDYDPHAHRVLPNPTNNWETLVHLVKCSLGTGILAMPQAFARAGLGTGALGTLVAGVLVTHCLHVLVRAQYAACRRRRVPLLSYPAAMAAALEAGPAPLRPAARPAALTVDVFLVVYQLGICCVYIVFIADNIKKKITWSAHALIHGGGPGVQYVSGGVHGHPAGPAGGLQPDPVAEAAGAVQRAGQRADAGGARHSAVLPAGDGGAGRLLRRGARPVGIRDHLPALLWHHPVRADRRRRGDRAREQHGDAARVRRAVRRAQLGHGADRAAVRGGGGARLRLLRRQLQGLHHARPAPRTAGDQRDRDVRGGYLHQLRAALLRAGGGGVALRAAAPAAARRAAHAAPRRDRAARGALPAHLRAGGGRAAAGPVHLPVRRAVPVGAGHLLPGADGGVPLVPAQGGAGAPAPAEGRAAVCGGAGGPGGGHLHGAGGHHRLLPARPPRRPRRRQHLAAAAAARLAAPRPRPLRARRHSSQMHS